MGLAQDAAQAGPGDMAHGEHSVVGRCGNLMTLQRSAAQLGVWHA